MKKKWLALITCMILALSALTLGCGTQKSAKAPDKFEGLWVTKLTYDQVATDASFNKYGLTAMEVKKGQKGEYEIHAQNFGWDISTEGKSKALNKVDAKAKNPEGTNDLKNESNGKAFTYNEEDKCLHFTNKDGADIVYQKIENQKALDAIKARVDDLVTANLPKMKSVAQYIENVRAKKPEADTKAAKDQAEALVKQLVESADQFAIQQ
jgi:hypothetical protein